MHGASISHCHNLPCFTVAPLGFLVTLFHLVALFSPWFSVTLFHQGFLWHFFTMVFSDTAHGFYTLLPIQSECFFASQFCNNVTLPTVPRHNGCGSDGCRAMMINLACITGAWAWCRHTCRRHHWRESRGAAKVPSASPAREQGCR